MQYTINEGPSYAMVDVELDEGEMIQTKPGAMMTRDGSVSVQSDVGGDGGIGDSVKRAISDERTLVDNTYTATNGVGSVTLVPEHPGDVIAVNMSDRRSLRVQSGSLLGWEPLVERSTELNNLSNMFNSGELTVLGLSGQGTAFLSAFGSMVEREVTPQESLIVDEDHLVAWTPELSLNRQKDGGLKSTVLGGEGLVTEFTGQGHVWLQTRDPMLFSTGTEHQDDETSGGIGVDDFI
ncbi:TIGR00266 family protein [Halovenus marina]|uniref:TIGR00266 family protein n=1 Tax=Halovenus marina TaxID=3396621 RepID=UPI003F5713FD